MYFKDYFEISPLRKIQKGINPNFCVNKATRAYYSGGITMQDLPVS